MDIPQIDTTNIPPKLLLHGVLAQAVEKLDGLSESDRGTQLHSDLVRQVISDAKEMHINVLAI